MNVRIRRGVVLAAVAALLGLGFSAPAAQAADCRYDQWGSNSWKGQKYKCRDGSSLYIKPQYGGWDDWNSTPRNSWETWRGTDTYGNRYNCTWDNWRGTWKCR